MEGLVLEGGGDDGDLPEKGSLRAQECACVGGEATAVSVRETRWEETGTSGAPRAVSFKASFAGS